MLAKTNESPGIKSKMDDVAEAVAAVKRDLIEVLPKMRRATDRANRTEPTPANSCGFLRTADCVGICVACQRHSQLSRRKTRLCAILLGELWPLLKVAAPDRNRPQDDASRSAAWSFDGDAVLTVRCAEESQSCASVPCSQALGRALVRRGIRG